MSKNEEKIRGLIDELNEASRVYYDGEDEIMDNFTWDAKFDELKRLEKESGIVFHDSPTKNVGTDIVSKLKKITHKYPALSLDKTKNKDVILSWLGSNAGCLSYKLDGLTVVASYKKGKLVLAATRGSGTIGEDITHNTKHFIGIPQEIPYKEDLTVRGEAVISYEDFNRINDELNEDEPKYKNPRNLVSGTVRQLDPNKCKGRNVNYIVFEVVEGLPGCSTYTQAFEFLKNLGFNPVEHVKVEKDNLSEKMDSFTYKVKDFAFPVDGLVITYDDIAYGRSLGSTSHHARNGMAFKWKDQAAETTIKNIEWSASRTGLLNPVAVFEPVELEGTTVSRATVHNVSVIEDLGIEAGSKISVVKSNMIIPMIVKNLSSPKEVNVPTVCPVCKGKTRINSRNGIKTLYCENPNCPAKHIGSFERFVCRDALNIEGLSSATIEKFINEGFIRKLTDLFYIDTYKDKIIALEGFKEKSYSNIINSIEKSKQTTFTRLLYCLGIANFGRSASKRLNEFLEKNFDNGLKTERLIDLLGNRDMLIGIKDIGDVLADSLIGWFNNSNNKYLYNRLICILTITDNEITKREEGNKMFDNLTFVITGSLNHYENRDKLKEFIEENGGKVTGSVSKNTNYLINNDVASTSGKNKKAKEVGCKIISEEEFEKLIK